MNYLENEVYIFKQSAISNQRLSYDIYNIYNLAQQNSELHMLKLIHTIEPSQFRTMIHGMYFQLIHYQCSGN